MMKRTKKRLILCVGLLVALLAFIWGNSAMPGQESGKLSGLVAEILQTLLPFLSLESDIAMFILRKIAHFSEFCALGVVLSWLFGMLTRSWGAHFLLSMGCGVLAACVDEIIQIFSPGRYCSIVDVGIDSCGVLTGVLFLLLGYAVLKKIRK